MTLQDVFLRTEGDTFRKPQAKEGQVGIRSYMYVCIYVCLCILIVKANVASAAAAALAGELGLLVQLVDLLIPLCTR